MTANTVEIIRILCESALAAKYESDRKEFMELVSKVVDYHIKED